MYKILLVFFLLSTFFFTINAQTVILDFETTETSTNFQSFGNSQEGVISEPLANPNPSGENTSATVLAYTKAGDAPTWGGAYSNPDPTNVIALNKTHFCVKVHMDHIGNIAMKFEGGQNGAPDWIQKENNTKVNVWGEICFDVSSPSIEAPQEPARGNTYTRIVFFVDFDIAGTGEGVTTYLDDFVVKDKEVVIEPPTESAVVLDFETEETSTNFQSFGGTEDLVVNSPIANPNPSGINPSSMVMRHVKAGDAPDWGGAFSNPNPTRKIDLTTANQICVKTHKDHTGNFALKLEEGEGPGAADWIYTMPTTKVGEWEEICFDVRLPSIENVNSIAQGNVYNKIVFFMDFKEEGTGEDVTSYLDDFVVKSEAYNEMIDVTFTLNTNSLSNVNSVYVNGGFNEWCGECNEMSDDDGDGIYTATVSVTKGVHEYKYTVNGSEEVLSHTMECVKVTGEFINRFSIFGENTELPPVAFGSCYNVGDGANITFRLGFPDGVTPTDSIYLAGGVNFENPGGRFRMLDDNNDGIYEITVERLKGFESYYTFANGNCPGFDAGCKEDITGQDCAQADNFNDRWLPAVEEDVIISTCYGLCSTTANCSGGRVDVGFAIDMNGYEGNFSAVHVSGSFNDYCADCDVLSDDNDDGIYTATVSVPTGNLEYYYIVDGVAESFPRGSECGVSGNDSRNDFVIEDKQMDATCFNSCYACGQAVSLTFRLGFPEGVEPAEEVYLAGGINFEEPGGRFQLLDDNGDGIYEMVLERGLGFSSYYTFANGNCPGFDEGCKENIEGQDCAIPDNFNDRWLPELTGDTVIETCFEICTTDIQACQGVFIDRFDVDNNMFQLIPNLTQDLAKISFSKVTADSKSIKVFDNVGRLVFATELEGNELEHTLSTDRWNNGMYFIQVQINNTLGSQKLMKY